MAANTIRAELPGYPTCQHNEALHPSNAHVEFSRTERETNAPEQPAAVNLLAGPYCGFSNRTAGQVSITPLTPQGELLPVKACIK